METTEEDRFLTGSVSTRTVALADTRICVACLSYKGEKDRILCPAAGGRGRVRRKFGVRVHTCSSGA